MAKSPKPYCKLNQKNFLPINLMALEDQEIRAQSKLIFSYS